jgi:glutamyl-tRNA reductase
LRIHFPIMYSISIVHPELIISRLIVVGVNYRHADVSRRSLFSVLSSNCHSLLEDAKSKAIKSLFILSTCNRTELYAYCHDPEIITDLLINHSQGTKETFKQVGFVKRGHEALTHLFRVAAGLDSQITGDYEIQAQLKDAISFSREHKMIGPVMDRTVNFALQASKAVRANTKLSTGTVSVSYAAIERIKKIENIDQKKIVLIGTGALGTTLAKNLRHYFPQTNVTLVNRTVEKAQQLAGLLSFDCQSFDTLQTLVNQADIIISATNAPGHIIHPHFFSGLKKQWILDLSVPANADPRIREIDNIVLYGIDDVSKVMEITRQTRNNEVPKAISILHRYEADFFTWLELQKHVPMINEMKDKLLSLGEIHFSDSDIKELVSTRVNKTVGLFAMKLRYKHEKGCHYINAINEFLQTGIAHE